MPSTFRPAHQPTREAQKREQDQRRGSARERGYSRAWDKAAAGFKNRHPLCLGCEAVGRLVATDCVDHVVPHKGDKVRFWERRNWQPSCRWHHDVIKQKLEGMFAKGQIGERDLRLDSEAARQLTIQFAAT